MKRFLCVLAILAVFCLFSSPVQAVEKEWTFLVFLNADNNLDPYGVKNQDQMATAGSNDYLNIITLIDRYNAPATLNYIDKNKIVKLKDMGELDMGDYNVLVQFVKDMVAQYPAKHYALVIWNHGSGWVKGPSSVTKGISYDESSGHHITTDQLQTAMGQIKGIIGHNLDLLAMDACLMEMMEVTYALKDSVDFVVGSEETEPGDGYPYDKILPGLKQGMSPADFSKVIVQCYADYYQNADPSGDSDLHARNGHRAIKATQSAVDCSKLSQLKTALDEMCTYLMKGNYAPQIKEALSKVQRFETWENGDLRDFIDLLKNSIKEDAFQKLTANLDNVLDQTIVSNGVSGENDDPEEPPPGGFHYGNRSPFLAHGLSIYLPGTLPYFASAYMELTWAKDSQWDEMLKDYYQKSQSTTIISDLETGNLNSLRDFVRTAGNDNRDVTEKVLSNVNFRVFCEDELSKSLQSETRALLSELKSR
ncbi:MAG: hypothetical protein HQM08_21465 [Candidatus Riflebacteria bacterium]|nr:hypothetical protein [Candidatus Riflebacteria bacterium]